MSEYKRCRTCKEFDWIPNHKCAPRWRVRESDLDEDESVIIHAIDEREAAKLFVERWDLEDFHVARGGSVEVTVMPESEGEPKRFSVWGEFVPSYMTSEVVNLAEEGETL